MTIREIVLKISQALTPIYGTEEARSIAWFYLTELTGRSRSSLLMDDGQPLHIEHLDADLQKLQEGYPVQYLTGGTEFYGHPFAVGEGVLIPRPETEELVDWILHAEKEAVTVLDVGTGSGCIAGVLAVEQPRFKVFATDLSQDALRIAQQNFDRLHAPVTLRKGDALQNLEQVFPERFDVIVSNPPYVPQSDLESMDRNVKDYEPHLALFVPDDDTLRFYRAIAHQGQRMLKSKGRLYFEIYHLYALEMEEMLLEEGYEKVVVREDLFGKPRMICCQKAQ